MSHRIILDRSIFHGESFNRLKESKFRSLCDNRVFSVYLTPILMEETLKLWHRSDKRVELVKNLKYILSIWNARIFREMFEIFNLEFSQNYLTENYFYLSKAEAKEKVDAIRELIIEENMSLEMEEEIKQARDSIEKRKKNRRRKDIECRELVSEKLKSVGRSRASLNELFDVFVEKCIMDLAKEIIDCFIDVKLDKDKLFKHWLKHKSRYQYFNQWLKSYLFIFYYAVAYPNEPIDRNAQEDIEQLVFLQGLDMLISNDQKFMKRAFIEIYGTSDKKYLSLDEFLLLVN